MRKTPPEIQRWYNSKHWKRRRAWQLQCEPFCRMCREENRAVPAIVADHIEPHKGDYKKFHFGELQSLCKLHHDAAKARIENRGYDTRIGRDGWPIDPNHPAYKE
jgi:hypothetical protein